MMRLKPILFKWFLNIYPPYLGSGIRVKYIASDYREIIVKLKMHWYNRNYVRTHFGGSLYGMTDPFYMLMLIQILGGGYIVWDKAAKIDFIKPGKGTLTARFTLDEKQIEEIRQQTVNGNKYLPDFVVHITNEENVTVAKVIKTLYIRRKEKKSATENSE